ncbi:Mu transposase C-terminal domain-containing protein [Paenibacillus sp. FSL H7-0714]|uniref:Mu transposase C-terminal domain-containing protein n=1 Tax=Paenibacillus sp. FSL H7-0714 TaxID=2954735 RepID=UPI0030FC0691
MARNQFNVGTKFLMDGLEYLIKRSGHEELLVEVKKYKQTQFVTIKELEQAWYEERLIFKDPTDKVDKIKLDLGQLTSKEDKKIKMKLEVLQPVINGTYHTINLDKYLKELEEQKGIKVKKATFYNWKKTWEKYQDARYLLDMKTGPKKRRTEEEVMGTLEKIMDEEIYGGEETYYREIYRLYKGSLNNVNELRDENQKEIIRSFQTIWRIVKDKRDYYRQQAAREGPVAARLKRDGSKSMSEKPTRPLERVELDWTPIDLKLVDPKNLQRKRPWLVYAIDVFSGEPLGFYITFDHPDSFAIKQCLLHCIMPKSYVKKLYPDVKNEWIAYGIPKELVIDNASQNNSYDLEEVFNFLGIQPLYPEVAAGHKKGTVERGLKTFNDIMHTLRGTTFSNIYQKKQYDSEGKACITLQAIYYIAHIIFVDIISHNLSHTRMGGTPHQKWKNAFENDPSLTKDLPFSKKEITLILCGGREKRIIQNRGITIKETWYTSNELMELRYRLIQNGDENTKVLVRFDFSDTRKLYVEDPYNKSFIEVFIDPNKVNDMENHYDVEPNLPLPFEQLKVICLSEGRYHREFNDEHVIQGLKNIKKIEQNQLSDKRNKYKNTLEEMRVATEGLAMQSFDMSTLDEPENIESLVYVGEITTMKSNKSKLTAKKDKVSLDKIEHLKIPEEAKIKAHNNNDDDDLPSYGVSKLGG